MSAAEVREALAELEAIIAADPANADAELLAAAEELRDAMRDAEEATTAGADAAREDDDVVVAVPGDRDDAADDADAARKRKRVEAGEDAKDDDDDGDDDDDDDDARAAPIPTRAPNGDRMHPRNAYREKNPDFAALAKRHPALLPHLRSRGKGRHVIDFTSYDATRELNAAMLAVDYGILRWTVPPGHLIPPVANRANYVHWIQDLLRASRPDGVEIAGPTVLGLDVGVGANCVYPLIGAATHGWRFVGCDVADAALAAATANASANANVASLIEIRDSRRGEGGGEGGGGGGVLLPAIRDGERFAFSMCNPPFFETMAEAELNAGTNFGGTETEMCYPNGGEHAFVRAMYEDSLTLRDRVHWYTTMCGKKETMKKLRRALEMRSSITFRTTEFLQGRTTRWGIAWSFAKDALEKTNRRGASNANALDAATTAAATPKCWRMTFEVQASARGRAGKKPPTASDVLERLRRELSSATTTSISIETDASDPLRLNCALELPSPSPSSTSRGPPHAFTASVMRSAPGTLTVAAALAEGAKSRDAAKTAFATAMARARAAMRSPETYE